jgi:hypothetical protein
MIKKLIFLSLIGIILLFFGFVPVIPILSGKILIFIFVILVNLILKLPAKFTIMTGLLLMLTTAFLLLINHSGMALRFSVYAYGLLVIGAVLQFFE